MQYQDWPLKVCLQYDISVLPTGGLQFPKASKMGFAIRWEDHTMSYILILVCILMTLWPESRMKSKSVIDPQTCISLFITKSMTILGSKNIAITYEQALLLNAEMPLVNIAWGKLKLYVTVLQLYLAERKTDRHRGARYPKHATAYEHVT